MSQSVFIHIEVGFFLVSSSNFLFYRQAGEIVFLDASGGMDQDGTRVFLLITHTSGGGVPLGGFYSEHHSTVIYHC